jgi:hypothetical protein
MAFKHILTTILKKLFLLRRRKYIFKQILKRKIFPLKTKIR